MHPLTVIDGLIHAGDTFWVRQGNEVRATLTPAYTTIQVGSATYLVCQGEAHPAWDCHATQEGALRALEMDLEEQLIACRHKLHTLAIAHANVLRDLTALKTTD